MSTEVEAKTSSTKHGGLQKGFCYIVEIRDKGTRDITDYLSYQRYYYDPTEQESHAEAFVIKFNKDQFKQDTYVEFMNQFYPRTFLFNMEDEDTVIIVITQMDFENELIAIQMPEVQYSEFFGKHSHFVTYYKGKN